MKAFALLIIALLGALCYVALDNKEKARAIEGLRVQVESSTAALAEAQKEAKSKAAEAKRQAAALADAQKKLEESGIALAAAQRPDEPEAEPNYFAPEGVFFLTVKKSAETADGISGLRPGTRLQKQDDGSYKTEQGLTLQAEPHQVTNDLRIAQQMLAVDAAGAAALRRQMAEWTAAERGLSEQTKRAAGTSYLPPGSQTTTTTTLGPDGRTRVYSHTTTTTTVPQPVAPAAPTSKLDQGAYGEKKAIKRPFRIDQ